MWLWFPLWLPVGGAGQLSANQIGLKGDSSQSESLNLHPRRDQTEEQYSLVPFRGQFESF